MKLLALLFGITGCGILLWQARRHVCRQHQAWIGYLAWLLAALSFSAAGFLWTVAD